MKYSKAKIEECVAWVQVNGLTDHGGALVKDFCRAMDISQETFYEWLRNKTEFSDAIKKAKEVYRGNLEQTLVASLAKSATGYDVDETRTEIVDVNGTPKIKKQVKTKKHFAPNTGAAIFLLTNIAPERWKNKINNEHSGDLSGGLTILVKDDEQKKLIEGIKDL